MRYWVSSTDVEEFERKLRADETVATYDVLRQEPSRSLYQIRLSDTGQESSFIPLLGEFGGELIDGKQTDGQWIIQLRFPDHSALQGFFDTLNSNAGVSIQLDSIHQENSLNGGIFGLTPSQFEALQAACEQGYFDIPRKTSLNSLSEGLNISDQAVSERLRRAQKQICEHIFK